MEKSRTGNFFRKGNQAVLILAVILLVFISPFVKGAVGGLCRLCWNFLLPFWLIVGLGIGAMALLVGGNCSCCGWSRAFGCNDRNRDHDHRNWMSDDCSGNPYGIGTDSIAVRIVPKWFRKITDFFNRVLYRKRKEEVK